MRMIKDMLDFLGWPYKILILSLIVILFVLAWVWNRE